MKIQNLQKTRLEARSAEVRQLMVYDQEQGRYTDEPARDEQGRLMYSTQVDLVSDVEPDMTTEYVTVHAATAPVLQVTQLHQPLIAENLRLEVWRSKSRCGYSLHCDGLRVYVPKAESAKAE